MGDFITSVTSVVAHHPSLAILVAFIAAVVEAVAVLGCILPGTPVLMAVAGAAGMCGMSALPILAVAIIGAVIGDGISFWLGVRYSDRLRGMWPFSRRPEMIASSERFFRRYGSVAVAVGRFVPVMRSTVPLVAGMSGMPRKTFIVANILSAFVWAPAHVIPARMAGLSIDRVASGDYRLAFLTAALFAALAAAGWAIHRWVARGMRSNAA